MLKISGKTIELTRGDTAYIYFVANMKESGEPRPLKATDTVIFRLSATSLVEIECDINTTTNKALLSILPEHTIDIPFGTYRYEVELVTEDEEHFTFIADSLFTIGKEYEQHGN